MSYRYDIFLSYSPHGIFKDWVCDEFLPLFKFYLEEILGREVTIFSGEDEIDDEDTWSLVFREAFAYSKCLVAFWHPSYFMSESCRYASYLMIQRERQENYRTSENPEGLIYPINLFDGERFPDFARNMSQFDFKPFVRRGLGFSRTERYIQFQDNLIQLSEIVARGINHAPPWKKAWLETPEVEIPEISPPLPFPLPIL